MFERSETYLAFAPKGFKQFLFSCLFVKSEKTNFLKNIDSKFNEEKLFFLNSRCKCVGAMILQQWCWRTTVAIGDQNKISMKKEINFPNSLDFCIQHLHITVVLRLIVVSIN